MQVRRLRVSMLKLEPETHGVRESSQTSSASERITERTSICKPCMTGDDITLLQTLHSCNDGDAIEMVWSSALSEI